MYKRSPLTVQVVSALSDCYQESRARFLTDGRLDHDERATLNAIGRALRLAERADVGRKRAISLMDNGELTEWDRRQWQDVAQLDSIDPGFEPETMP